VDQRRHVIEEEPRRQPVAAEEGAGRALVETLDAARAACEIDEENPPAIALHGRALYPLGEASLRYAHSASPSPCPLPQWGRGIRIVSSALEAEPLSPAAGERAG